MRLMIRSLRDDDAPRRDDVERRFRFALGRFAPRIGRVTITMADVNGPRGGLDKRCRVVVGLVPRGHVIAEVSDRSYDAASCRAADRVGHAVGRELERRRGHKDRLSASGRAT